MEFSCGRIFGYLIGVFCAVVSVNSATQVPWFALMQPATDLDPDGMPSYGMESAPNWHAFLGYRGVKLWADPALFLGPHAALLAILLMGYATWWTRDIYRVIAIGMSVRGHKASSFAPSDAERADEQLRRAAQLARDEEGRELEAPAETTATELREGPFVWASFFLYAHALPTVLGDRPGLPNLGPLQAYLGMCLSSVGLLSLLARTLVPWYIEREVQKLRNIVGTPFLPEAKLHLMCRKYGVRVIDANGNPFSDESLVEQLVPEITEEKSWLTKNWCCGPPRIIAFFATQILVLSEVVPDFTEICDGVWAWVGFTTIAQELEGECERGWCDRLDPEVGWMPQGVGEEGNHPHRLSGHGPYAGYAAAGAVIGRVICALLLLWWCRVTKDLLCPGQQSRTAQLAHAGTYHELQREDGGGTVDEELAGAELDDDEPYLEDEEEEEEGGGGDEVGGLFHDDDGSTVGGPAEVYSGGTSSRPMRASA